MRSAEQRRDTPREGATGSAIMRSGGVEQLCLVENISPQGACLRINPDLPPLDRFELLLQERAPLRVRRVWRSGDRIGVRRIPHRAAWWSRMVQWATGAGRDTDAL